MNKKYFVSRHLLLFLKFSSVDTRFKEIYCI